jgi:YidC/Oxa1 family membrane protein insertase
VIGGVWAQAAGASGGPDASQAGLPPELVISPKPAIETQQKALEQILFTAAGEQASKSGGGFGGALKGLFVSKPQTAVVDVPTLFANAQALRSSQIEVHGVLRTVGKQLAFRAERGDCMIELAGGVKPEGFPEGSLDWMPAMAKGIVEMPFDKPVVHAIVLKPSVPLAELRLARVLEVQKKTREAVTQYQKASMDLQRARITWGAFASTHAGWLAYSELRDAKMTKNVLYMAWTTYAVVGKDGKAVYNTWVPRADGKGWDKQPVAEAIGPLLDKAARDSFWYRLVDFFATVAGGSAALGVILLALVARVCMHPLTRKQLGSAQAMQRLQPQIKALQEEFKDDKQRFQQEMWRVWQENGVNPFGGCWPMLIQMPILIMVYQGIRGYVVQFSHSGFLWVHNLAMPDIVLLVAYTASMVLFQQMTNRLQPMPADDKQRQQQQMMTWMMPLMFFFFFRTLPAAFILYWLASNIFYFGEQAIYRYQVRAKEAAGIEGAPTGAPTKKRSRFMDALVTSMDKTKKQPPAAPTPSKPASPAKPPARGGQTGSRKRKK